VATLLVLVYSLTDCLTSEKQNNTVNNSSANGCPKCHHRMIMSIQTEMLTDNRQFGRFYRLE